MTPGISRGRPRGKYMAAYGEFLMAVDGPLRRHVWWLGETPQGTIQHAASVTEEPRIRTSFCIWVAAHVAAHRPPPDHCRN